MFTVATYDLNGLAEECMKQLVKVARYKMIKKKDKNIVTNVPLGECMGGGARPEPNMLIFLPIILFCNSHKLFLLFFLSYLLFLNILINFS